MARDHHPKAAPPRAARAQLVATGREDRAKYRIGTIFVCSLVVAFALWNTRDKPGPVRARPPERLDQISTKQLTSYLADQSVVGGALAAERAAAKNNATTPNERIIERNHERITLRNIRSRSPHETEAAAREEALAEVQSLLSEQLARLDPPVTRTPSLAELDERVSRAGSSRVVEPTREDQEAWQAAGLNPQRVWVSLDVELKAEDLRQFRQESRLGDAARMALGIFLLGGIITAFFRLDRLTKGWFSITLGFLAIAAGGTLATGLIWGW